MAVDWTKLLAEVTDAVTTNDLGRAERLLAPVVRDESALAAAPAGVQCRITLDWGWLHGATQRYAVAVPALTKAVEIAEQAGLPAMLTEAVRELALVARYQDNFAGADELLTMAGQLAQANDDPLAMARTLHLHATVAHQLGDFARGRELLTRARAAAAAFEERADTSSGINQIQAWQIHADIGRETALSARIARDYDGARKLLTDARTRYESAGMRVGVANVLRELGAVAEQVGDKDAARRHYGEAFVAFLRNRRRLGAAVMARRLGLLDAVSPKPAENRWARSRFRQALRLGAGELTNAALTTMYQAKQARSERDLDEVDRLLGVARTLYLKLAPTGAESPPSVARGLSQISLETGLIARHRGNRAEALASFREALRLLRDDDPSARSLVHHEIATELIIAGDVAEALRHAVAAFELNEDSGRRLSDPTDRLLFYGETSDSYALAMHCAARAGEGPTALRIATAAQSEALAAFVRAGARLTPELRELVDDIAVMAATVNRLSADERGSGQKRLTELYERLASRTSQQLRAAIGPAEIAVEEIVTSLPSGGHALLLDAFEHETRICTRVWVRPDAHIEVDQVMLPERVREFLDAYQDARQDVAWSPQEDLLTALGDAVIPRDLADALVTRPASLVISTGNVLGPFPVAAVRVGGRYLAELAQLAVVPSLALWTSLRSRPARSGAGVLAYVNLTLTGAHRETTALREALAPVKFLDAAAVRPALADAENYSVVVLGAHGSPPPASGALVDGDASTGLAQALMLTTEDRLTAADLLACTLPDGLITASCWSGRLIARTAVEPFGIPTAGLLAGARWVLAGTVDLGGPATARLLSDFYGGLARGETPSTALHHAQITYLARRPAAPPGLWAGLVIVGDGFTPVRPKEN